MKLPTPTMLAVEFPKPKAAKKSPVKAMDVTPAIAAADKYKEPTPRQKKVEAAHRAHRDVVEKWVAGDASTQKVKQSKSRLDKVMKGHV